jgi:periplasmic nitrate reductase NapE
MIVPNQMQCSKSLVCDSGESSHCLAEDMKKAHSERRRWRVTGEGAVSDTPVSLKRRAPLQVVAVMALAALLVPILALSIVGGYGFSVWIYQIMAGPPGALHAATVSTTR